jgi:LytS/YehU family sensor histidine kinase
MVPPMSVQTLVENSVKYAVSPRREGGQIRVKATLAAPAGLLIAVWDDGAGFSPDARPQGHGLDLLESRLRAQYGPKAALKFARGQGMTVTMELPCAPTS